MCRRLKLLTIVALSLPASLQASTDITPANYLNLTGSFIGILCLLVFFIGYLFVLGEEYFHLRKSKPIIVAAGVIWLLVGLAYTQHGDTVTASIAVRHNLLEFAELFFFNVFTLSSLNAISGKLRAASEPQQHQISNSASTEGSHFSIRSAD